MAKANNQPKYLLENDEIALNLLTIKGFYSPA